MPDGSPPLSFDSGEYAAALPGPNLLLTPDGWELVELAGDALKNLAGKPDVLKEGLAGGLQDTLAAVLGTSDLSGASDDKRFRHPLWSTHPAFKRLRQVYLGWTRSIDQMAKASSEDWRAAERARFLSRLLMEALAPTNAPLSNPAALEQLRATAGRSLVRGLRNFVDDARHHYFMPSQARRDAFQVGVNVAATPGDVVYRTPMFELIEYRSSTKQVAGTPLVLVCSPVNKHYLLDLSRGRSLAQHMVEGGMRCFILSWRNPTAAQRDRGLAEYVESLSECLDVACEISGTESCHLLAVCAAGIFGAVMAARQARIGLKRLRSLTLAVAPIDQSLVSLMGVFMTERTVAKAKERATRRGVVTAAQIVRGFNMLRPAELVWSFWVNNYLLGLEPPESDLLFWNDDQTNVTAARNNDLLDIAYHNHLMHPDAMSVGGTPIDLKRIDCEVYVMVALSDHIVPWATGLSTINQLAVKTRMVVCPAGHVQAILSAPGMGRKVRFLTNPKSTASADEWLAQATETEGSWWDDWLLWLKERSDGEAAAPRTTGSRRHSRLQPAPGRYVRYVSAELEGRAW